MNEVEAAVEVPQIKPTQSLLLYNTIYKQEEIVSNQQQSLLKKCIEADVFNPFQTFEEILEHNEDLFANFSHLLAVVSQIVSMGYGTVIYPLGMNSCLQIDAERLETIPYLELLKIISEFCSSYPYLT